MAAIAVSGGGAAAAIMLASSLSDSISSQQTVGAIYRNEADSSSGSGMSGEGIVYDTLSVRSILSDQSDL